MCQPIAALASFSLVGETTPVVNGGWSLFELPFSRELLNNSAERYYFVARPNAQIPEEFGVGLKRGVNASEFVTMHLENNRPCAVGNCRNGVCVESRNQNVGRLWPLFLTTSGWSKSKSVKLIVTHLIHYINR